MQTLLVCEQSSHPDPDRSPFDVPAILVWLAVWQSGGKRETSARATHTTFSLPESSPCWLHCLRYLIFLRYLRYGCQCWLHYTFDIWYMSLFGQERNDWENGGKEKLSQALIDRLQSLYYSFLRKSDSQAGFLAGHTRNKGSVCQCVAVWRFA